jgi:3-deoxy-D-manno-octulosonic-acid transferase
VDALFYKLFLWSYGLAVKLVVPWNAKARRWMEGRKNIMEKIAVAFKHESSPVVWMHCASLGEFEQGRPILEKLRSRYQQYKFLLTFYSPSGFEVRKDYKGADYIFYLPLDSPTHSRQFIDLVNPKFVLWIKYDYWFYYLDTLKKKDIPLVLVSGIFRKDHVFFRWYGGLQREMLHAFTHFFVQTDGSADRLQKLGIVSNVTVSGDTRFDRVIEIAERFTPIPVIENFCATSRVIVAGSTWLEDEEEIDHFANAHPEIKFIIAPHEVDESRLAEIEGLFETSIRLSELQSDGNAGANANVLIIDNIGMLSKLYHYATIAYVGGGFGDEGVHNVLEAAVYAKPVVFGPVYDRYIEAVELVGSGGGFSVENALEAEELFNSLLNNREDYAEACEASKEYVYSKKGATDIILRVIQEKRLLTN